MTPNPTPPADDDLDFTKPAAAPPPPPTPQQLETAHKEAATGGAELRKAGYYVAIARRATAKVPPRNGERHCLLVVEDDPDLSNLLAEIFSVAGFEVRRAANRAQINAGGQQADPPGPDPARHRAAGRRRAADPRAPARAPEVRAHAGDHDDRQGRGRAT